MLTAKCYQVIDLAFQYLLLICVVFGSSEF